MKFLYGRVAVASHRFQSFAVQDMDVPAAIFDESVSLQATRRRRDGHAFGAENLAQYLLSDIDSRRLGKILRGEEPARQPLRGPMDRVAPCRLTQNMGMHLDELEDVPVKIVVLKKCLLEVLERDLHSRAGKLHSTVRRSIHRPDQV